MRPHPFGGGRAGVGVFRNGSAVTCWPELFNPTEEPAKAQDAHFKFDPSTANRSTKTTRVKSRCCRGKVTLKEVFFNLVALTYAKGVDWMQEVFMTYGSIECGFKPRDAKVGLGTEVTFSWNVKTYVIA